MGMIENFEAMLAAGKDNALLRFSLGNEYSKAAAWPQAASHLRAAVMHDPNYSAAWKLLGKAHTALQQPDEAIAAYEAGMRAADAKGDKQAVKEMHVFMKRLQKS